MFPILLAGALLIAPSEEKTNCSASDTLLLEFNTGEKKPTAESILNIQVHAAELFRSCTITLVVLNAQQQEILPQITQDRIYEIASLLLMEGIDENIIETKHEIRSKIKLDKSKIGLVFRFQPLYSQALRSMTHPDCQKDTSIEQPLGLKLGLRLCDLKQVATLPSIQPLTETLQITHTPGKEVSVQEQFRFENPEAIATKLIWQNAMAAKKLNYHLEKYQADCKCWNSFRNNQFATIKSGKTYEYQIRIEDSGEYRIIANEQLIRKTYGLVCPEFIGIKKAFIENTDGTKIPVELILGGKALVVELTQAPENYLLIADFISLDGTLYQQQKIDLTACYVKTEKAPITNLKSIHQQKNDAEFPSQFGSIPFPFLTNSTTRSYEK